mmetsp:Transcript_3222/g.8555  ORF Transcript_3222/g.8555 Transcript_3222/m.8555 type:complete len:213 (+) Transcript_3222:130-768(+)
MLMFQHPSRQLILHLCYRCIHAVMVFWSAELPEAATSWAWRLRSTAKATWAAFWPLTSIAPKVGPIRGEPSISASSMPAKTIPGTISRVFSTMRFSAVFMSRAPIPGMSGTMPMAARRFTLAAPMGPSCPQEDTTTLDSTTLGSMQLCRPWFRATRVQFVTTPAMYLPPGTLGSGFTIRSSAAVALNSLTLGASRTLDSRVLVSWAACLTTT